ncbi:MAG: CotH kinase family protein [Clostridia bacterium]|nr:CotH kinase family protein [Clostridia bacterium]
MIPIAIGIIGIFIFLFFIHVKCADDLFTIVLNDEGVERIKPWRSENGDFYVFLPSYAELQNVELELDEKKEIVINKSKLYNKMNLSLFEYDTGYCIEYRVIGISIQKTITFMKSDDVPTIYIDTSSHSMKNIHQSKKNKEKASIRVYGDAGENCYNESLNEISGRGNYTWDHCEKKSYNIEFEQEVNLFGMGDAIKWILLANADDPSHIRNKIVFDYANSIGMEYTPKSCWVELYLNGEYVGLYLLCERNEIHRERVNISYENGWLVSLEVEDRLKNQNYPYVITNRGHAFRIHNDDDFTNDKRLNLKNIWENIESILFDTFLSDKEKYEQLSQIINIESWVKKYLIEEIFSGPDSGLVSQFFYYDNGFVYAGPVWDYDHTMGHQAYWQLSTGNSMYANRFQAYDNVYCYLFSNLYEIEAFRNQVISIFKKECIPVLADILVYNIEQYEEVIEKAALMNQIRWNVKVNAKEEAGIIKNHLNEHAKFLYDIWIDKEIYRRVQIDPGNGDFFGQLFVKDGMRIDVLPNSDDMNSERYGEFLGWYYSKSDKPFNYHDPITEDIQIYAKWERDSAFSIRMILLNSFIFLFCIIGVGMLIYEICCLRKRRC